MRSIVKRRMWYPVTMALIVGAGATEAAELLENHGHYGVHLGFRKTKDAEEGQYLPGGHLELQLTPWLAVAGGVEYRAEEDFRFVKDSEEPDMTVKSVPMTVSGRLYLPSNGGFQPFLSGGAGWYRQTFDFSPELEATGVEDRTVTNFGWHAGLGGRIVVGERVSLYGEGNYVFLDPQRDFGDDVQDQIDSLNYDSAHVAGGVNLHF